jgi:hypothetical protein
MQLHKSLTENTLPEEQLKDQECQNRQKQKEVDDLRQAVVDFEDQHRGFNEVLNHFQKTLLGNLGSPYFAACADISCLIMTLELFLLYSNSGVGGGGFCHRPTPCH